MRKYQIPVLSAVLGSAITLLIFVAFNIFDESKTPQIKELPDSPSTNVLYTANSEGEVVPLDFTDISK